MSKSEVKKDLGRVLRAKISFFELRKLIKNRQNFRCKDGR